VKYKLPILQVRHLPYRKEWQPCPMRENRLQVNSIFFLFLLINQGSKIRI
jgi:hypothetical protein